MTTFLLPIRFKISRSKTLFRFVMGFHIILAMLIFLLPDLNFLSKSLFLLLIIVNSRHVANRLHPCCDCEINYDAEGKFQIIGLGKEPCELQLLPGSLIHPSITILKFMLGEKHKINVCLVHDNINADDFRRLRVRLSRQKK